MSLWPRAFYNEPSFGSFFRFLEDFDNWSREFNPESRSFRKMTTFSPKFDVKETEQVYELHGELPGIEQKDVEIEFTDPQTLSIHGRTEHSYTEGQSPAGFIKGEVTGEAQKAGTIEATEKSETPQAKYWVSERSIGEFARTFSFPSRVNQDAVKASMKNGILSITVPKEKKHETYKITIS